MPDENTSALPPVQIPVVFVGGSDRDLRDFPLKAKREAGHQLDRVQRGLDPED